MMTEEQERAMEALCLRGQGFACTDDQMVVRIPGPSFYLLAPNGDSTEVTRGTTLRLNQLLKETYE